MLPRVVITGIGVVSPAGTGMSAIRETLFEGKSHTQRIDFFDTDQLPCKIGAPVSGFDPKTFLNAHELKRVDRSSQFFVAAARMAVEDSTYKEYSFDTGNIGVFEGSSLGGMESALNEHEVLLQRGPRAINPFMINKAMNGIGGSMVALQNNIHGPVMGISNGSVSSASAIITAFNLLRLKEIDLAIAGGCEAPLNYNLYSMFCRAGLMSHHNDKPETASRPFDINRSGLVLAEGAAVFVMERLESAQERGAKIYAEIISTAVTNDSYNLVAPAEDAQQQAKAMTSAITKANLTIDQIDYISAHGTSTQLNDKIETHAIRKAFGEFAFQVPISATKSMFGHSLGACTAIEMVCAITSMQYDFIPPTINLTQPDPDCNLNYVPNNPVIKIIETVLLKNSSFGGKNTVIILKKYEENR